MKEREEILAALQGLSIPYTLTEHPPVHTIDDCFQVQALPGGAQIPKNAFLCNRQGTAYYLMLLEPYAAFRTNVVSKALGVSRLSFAPEEALHEMLHLSPGAVTPLALYFDKEARVRLIVDARLKAHEYLAFHPMENTATVILPMRAFFEVFLPAVRHEPTFVEIAQA